MRLRTCDGVISSLLDKLCVRGTVLLYESGAALSQANITQYLYDRSGGEFYDKLLVCNHGK